MNKQVILLAFGLTLSAVSPVLAAGRNENKSHASARSEFEKPAPVSVVQPIVSTRHIGERVNLVFHLDEQGRPNRITSTSRVAKDLVSTLVAAVSQWEFTPARDASGEPRTAKVLLPVRITEPRP
jgi:hypothetical protein